MPLGRKIGEEQIQGVSAHERYLPCVLSVAVDVAIAVNDSRGESPLTELEMTCQLAA